MAFLRFPLRWIPKEWRTAKFKLPIEHWGREHYLPFTPNELVGLLLERSHEDHWDEVRFLELVAAVKRFIRLLYHDHHEFLIDGYSQYDPDRDIADRTAGSRAVSDRQQMDRFPSNGASSSIHQGRDGRSHEVSDREACRNLFSEIAVSLNHANYRRLSPLEIQRAIGAASRWGVSLRIRFSSFRRLEVYGRGDIVSRRTFRSWRHAFRLKEREVPIYQRLVVVFRAKDLQSFPEPLDPSRVHLRMFKNIPKADIDMMLPGSQVRLSWLDTGKIGIPTLWGIAMMTSKLAKSLWLLALFGTLKFLSSFFLIIAVLVATLFYGVKSVFSYTTTKRRYQLNITKSLYYQNLDNNLGALLRIEEEAEQQEICEAIVGCFVLIQKCEPMTSSEIDREAESILRELTGTDIDFDINDCMRDLSRCGVVEYGGMGWQLKGLDPP